MVYFEDRSEKAKKPAKKYRNPIYLAKEYKNMIKYGQAKSQSDLARMLGISRVRVNQIIRLLKLDNEIIKAIKKLGDPLKSQIITERILRPYIGKNRKFQLEILRKIDSYDDSITSQ